MPAASTRAGARKMRVPRPAFVRAGLAVLFGVIVEGARYLRAPRSGRTFDPLHVLASAAGALAAVGLERLAFTDAGAAALRRARLPRSGHRMTGEWRARSAGRKAACRMICSGEQHRDHELAIQLPNRWSVPQRYAAKHVSRQTHPPSRRHRARSAPYGCNPITAIPAFTACASSFPRAPLALNAPTTAPPRLSSSPPSNVTAFSIGWIVPACSAAA